MRHLLKPEPITQNYLFDDYHLTHWSFSLLSASARRQLEEGWQGVFRRSVLELMPAEEIGQKFSPDQGRPTKELYSVMGLLVISEFKSWTAEEAAQAYTYNADIQYALNLPRDHQYLCSRTVESYREKLRQGEDLAAAIFGDVTAKLVEELNLNIEKQRLDSTHIYSNMARLGRCQLMGTTIKRFLTQLKRHHPAEHEALPAELIERYAPAESRLFGFGKVDQEAYTQRIQQLAEDLHYISERFRNDPAIAQRATYKALHRVFTDQCEVVPAQGRRPAKAKIKEKATDANGGSGNVMQNPSDPEAGYDGHKGEGYQVQLAETYGNEINLVTGCIPQSASESDSASLEPVLESQMDYGLAPTVLLADTAYGSDANEQMCRESGIELISPVAGSAPTKATQPTATEQPNKEAGTEASEAQATKETATAQEQSPIEEAPSKAARLEARRQAQETKEWKEEYRKRSGVEGLNSGLKKVTGLDQLGVRGMAAVSIAVYLKVTGWNIKQAGRSYAQKACKARKTSRGQSKVEAQAA